MILEELGKKSSLIFSHVWPGNLEVKVGEEQP